MNTTFVDKFPKISFFQNSKQTAFDPHAVKAVNLIFDSGEALKYLSGLKNLHISQMVMKYFGTSLSNNLKGVSSGIKLIELQSSEYEDDFSDVFGEKSIFTPSQFWNNCIKMLEHERRLSRQEDSLLGENTYGVVFIVEKIIDGVSKKFSVNFYRECSQNKVDFYLSLFEYGGIWERGHYFATKVSR